MRSEQEHRAVDGVRSDRNHRSKAAASERVRADVLAGRATNHVFAVPAILNQSPVQVVFGDGALDGIGELAREAGGRERVLLVTDPAIIAAGHVARALEMLQSAGLDVITFDEVIPNPTTATVAAGLRAARGRSIGLIIGLGGGSALDAAKGINLLLTNGGAICDYWGDPPPDVLARREPLLPMILVPTTAGTGSEAQSFALISDTESHRKMACGDRRLPKAGGLRPRVAILDPLLTRTQPPEVAAATGIDALAHAVETAGCTRRNDESRAYSREAWRRLSSSFEDAILDPSNGAARAGMLLGAHLAGAAIEHAMLGAAHACANPLTARYDIVHGVAVGIVLPHVVRFNSPAGENPYSDLASSGEELARRIEAFRAAAGLSSHLSDHGVSENALPELAAEAAQQWTASFNPQPVGRQELRQIYRAALE